MPDSELFKIINDKTIYLVCLYFEFLNHVSQTAELCSFFLQDKTHKKSELKKVECMKNALENVYFELSDYQRAFTEEYIFQRGKKLANG